MTIKYNYKKQLNTSLENGSIRLDVSLNEYPRLTIVEYGTGLQPKNLGSTYNYLGMPFILESSSVRTLPNNAKLNNKFTDERTDTYIHAVKKIFEKKFKIGGSKSTVQKGIVTTDSIYSPLSAFIFDSSIQSISGEVKTSKDEEERTTTLRELFEPRLKIAGQVWSFAGSTIRFKTLGSGYPGFSFDDFVSDITLNINAVPTYKNTEISWNTKPLADKNLKNIKIVKIDDDSFYTYEGDWNPHIRPPTNQIPRDLSANSDMGGITKEFKIVNYKYGQPISEIEGVYGFANAAIELVSDPKRPSPEVSQLLALLDPDSGLSGNAIHETAKGLVGRNLGYIDANLSNRMDWRLISVKKKNYIYETVPISIGKAFIKKEDGTIEPVIVPAEYEPFLHNLNIEVLVAEETKGWELRRFKQEDAKDWQNGSIKAWIELSTWIENSGLLKQNNPDIYKYELFIKKCNLEQYMWRRIPIYEKTVYSIRSYSEFYKDADKVNWDVQYIPKNQLKGFRSTGDTTEVPVLFPNVDWTPDLMLVGKTRFKSSIATMGNPDWTPFVPNYYEQNPTTITSGSEEYEYVGYSILPSKNTKPQISDLEAKKVNIELLLANARAAQSIPGTQYKPHRYLNISDYGVPEAKPELVEFEKIGNFPVNNSTSIDRFLTFTTIKVSQGEGIKNNSTSTEYQLSEGRPPSAILRKPTYTAEINDETLTAPTDRVTKITSNIQHPTGEYIDSYSLMEADSLGQATRAAKFDLELSQIQANTASGLISFSKADSIDFGSICGSSISMPNIPGNKAVVKSASYTIQFSNGHAFIQPIEISIGFYESVTLTLSNTAKKVQAYKPEETNDTAISELLLNIDVGSLDTNSMIPDEMYSRWLAS